MATYVNINMATYFETKKTPLINYERGLTRSGSISDRPTTWTKRPGLPAFLGCLGSFKHIPARENAVNLVAAQPTALEFVPIFGRIIWRIVKAGKRVSYAGITG